MVLSAKYVYSKVLKLEQNKSQKYKLSKSQSWRWKSTFPPLRSKRKALPQHCLEMCQGSKCKCNPLLLPTMLENATWHYWIQCNKADRWQPDGGHNNYAIHSPYMLWSPNQKLVAALWEGLGVRSVALPCPQNPSKNSHSVSDWQKVYRSPIANDFFISSFSLWTNLTFQITRVKVGQTGDLEM